MKSPTLKRFFIALAILIAAPPLALLSLWYAIVAIEFPLLTLGTAASNALFVAALLKLKRTIR